METNRKPLKVFDLQGLNWWFAEVRHTNPKNHKGVMVTLITSVTDG